MVVWFILLPLTFFFWNYDFRRIFTATGGGHQGVFVLPSPDGGLYVLEISSGLVFQVLVTLTRFPNQASLVRKITKYSLKNTNSSKLKQGVNEPGILKC